MSLNQISISFAAIASPAIGGLLYGYVSMPVFLMCYIVASSIAIILESTMDFKLYANRKEVSETDKESVFQSIKMGIQYLKTQDVLMAIIWISLFINFLFGAFQVGYSYILIDLMKMASQHFGFTECAFAVGMLLMSIYFSIRKEVRFPLLVTKRGILGMAVVMAAISIPLMVSMNYWVIFSYYVALMFTFGSLIIIVNTPIQVMMQKKIDDDYKGRVFSIIETMSMALMPLGMVIYGFLYDLLPAQWILISSAILLMLVVLLLARPAVMRKAHPELTKKPSLPKPETMTS